MKVLVIDSHSGAKHNNHYNLHWINAREIAFKLNADFIWDYPNVNDEIKSGYDVIILVHSSGYAKIANEWLLESPNAKVFYVTNEWNIGEPLYLWSCIKKGHIKKYDVIANHPQQASKITNLYVNKWNIVNLNPLCMEQRNVIKNNYDDIFETYGEQQKNCIYYGSFRKDRTPYLKKYLEEPFILLSTHGKNIERFAEIGVKRDSVERIDWGNAGLSNYKASLYIEDVKTHTHYNHLANRFYEAVMYGVVPLFDISCKGTVEKSSYDIGDEYFVDSVEDVKKKLSDDIEVCDSWKKQVFEEKKHVLDEIEKIVKTVE